MAEPLVFLPGMMCDARLFGPQIAELSADTAVTVAPITMGDRMEETASALLDQLPKRFALAGLSMGGMVAMEILRRAPDRVTRLALIATNPLAETPVVAANREEDIVKVRADRLEEVMRAKFPVETFAPGPYRPQIIEMVLDMADTLGRDVFIRQSRALQRRKDQQATLSKCRVPVLVLCGAHDLICPVKRHEAMAELAPHAELQVLPDAGHFVTLEQPGEATAALRAWMRRPQIAK